MCVVSGGHFVPKPLANPAGLKEKEKKCKIFPIVFIRIVHEIIMHQPVSGNQFCQYYQHIPYIYLKVKAVHKRNICSWCVLRSLYYKKTLHLAG